MLRSGLCALQLGLLVCAGSLAGTCIAAGARKPAPVAVQQLRTHTQSLLYEALEQRDYDRAIVIVDGALRKGLPLAQYHLLKADIYSAMQNVEAEANQLRGALHEDPTLTEASLRLAALLERQGLAPEAVDWLRKAVQANPSAVPAYLALSDLLTRCRAEQDAVRVLEQARRIAPDDGRVLRSLAAGHESVGEKALALVEYRRAAELTTGRTRQLCLLKVGDLALEAKDYALAFLGYREAIRSGWEVSVELYPRLAQAADRTAWEVFEPVWASFQELLDATASAPVREELYLRVAAALSDQRQIMDFTDSLQVPVQVRREHAQRRFQHSLLVEALTDAVSYLDTGDPELASAARARHQDALAVRRAMGGGAE